MTCPNCRIIPGGIVTCEVHALQIALMLNGLCPGQGLSISRVLTPSEQHALNRLVTQYAVILARKSQGGQSDE